MSINSITSFLANLLIPINLSASILVAAVFFYLIKFNKTALYLTAFAIFWVYAWSTPIVSIYAGSLLENQYKHQAAYEYDSVQAIVVLGGNTANSRGNWFEPANRKTAVLRSDRAIDLYNANRADLIILSGASLDGGISEAGIMANKMKLLGIPEHHIIQEDHSQTTRENALYTAEILKKKNIQRFLLVTSALHMPRSFASFHKLGFQPVAAGTPAQITYPKNAKFSLFLPHVRTLNASRTIIKEYVALVVYWLRGWI